MVEPKLATFDDVVLEATEKYGVLVNVEPHNITFTNPPESEDCCTWYASMAQQAVEEDCWQVYIKYRQKGISPVTLPVFSGVNKAVGADLCLSLAVNGQRFTRNSISIQPFPKGPIGKPTSKDKSRRLVETHDLSLGALLTRLYDDLMEH